MDRIEKLRLAALNGGLIGDEFYYYFYKKYEELCDLEEESRYAEAFYDAFDKLTPSFTEGELIVGECRHRLSGEKQQKWEQHYRQTAYDRSYKAGGGQDSHMAIDYELVLAEGLNGIIQKIDGYLLTCPEENRAFYRCCRRCLEAVIRHSEHYADAALELSRQTENPKRRAELEEIARICRKVPACPANTFYEAVQSVHFVTYCLTFNPYRTFSSQQFQLGHPDRYLYPFYKKDTENGTLNPDFAQLLLDCLGIQINMRVPHGLSSGYMVGGRDENGNIVANELTGMCMQVIDDIRMVYPSVGLCCTEGMPERYLDKACSLLVKGYSHPALFNDDVITKGLMHYGVPEAQAHSYIHSTCVEITPAAASNVWVASPYTNMPQILLDLMDREYPSFDSLLDAFFARLDERIKSNFDAECRSRSVRAQNSINPLLSCFVNDCLKRGLDIERGGAQYNWIMPSFVGMANLVDSLYAVKTLVFDEKKLTLCDLKSAADSNFENSEALRRYILDRIPKYGNDCDEIDSLFGIFTEHIAEECRTHRGIHSNAGLIPSVFCWIMHEQFGRHTSATPDGRRAGFPLGDGSGPCQGREMNGPTASILSSTKWDHHKFIGGVAVNLKFSKASLGNDSVTTIRSLVQTYLKRGGFEVQINVVDNETLRKAQSDPEAYRDLVVRIGGYSDYFVTLSPEMQEEVILRTTHHV
ncbi:MAG: hypothetical protein IJF78_07845 [Clostridia bacterium]|nr:hypothetical protein [Clostridia bacterium]